MPLFIFCMEINLSKLSLYGIQTCNYECEFTISPPWIKAGMMFTVKDYCCNSRKCQASVLYCMFTLQWDHWLHAARKILQHPLNRTSKHWFGDGLLIQANVIKSNQVHFYLYSPRLHITNLSLFQILQSVQHTNPSVFGPWHQIDKTSL